MSFCWDLNSHFVSINEASLKHTSRSTPQTLENTAVNFTFSGYWKSLNSFFFLLFFFEDQPLVLDPFEHENLWESMFV